MDKKAMEKVREFDKKVRQNREYSEGFYKFPMLFCQLMGLFMIWFGQSTNSKQIFIWMISYVSFVCMDLNMYAGAYEKGKKICVYELLEYLPVNKMDIFRVRFGYLKNKMKKQVLPVCLACGIGYFGLLILLTALFFGGEYSGVGASGLMILCGSILAAMTGTGQGRRGKRLKRKEFD